jgi:deazaflavin-dependent oxidoreductase (nitroreductase family)
MTADDAIGNIAEALKIGVQIVDITTVGRRTGLPRRFEINLKSMDGRLFINGVLPGRRDWLANLRAHPAFTLHLKEHVVADLQATSREITDDAESRALFPRLMRADAEGWTADSVEEAVREAPLVEVEVARSRDV